MSFKTQPNLTTHGTTTVRFLNDIYANGTVTAGYFSGNGAGITGLTASGSNITPSSINTSGTLNAGATTVSSLTSGSTTVSTFTTTGSITAGSAGGFKVDTSGSMTATTITTTGSVTASTLAIAGNVFKVDSAGSMTATTITSTGSMTVSGTLTAASNSFRADTDAIKITSRLGIGTTTPNSLYLLQVTNDSDTGVVFSSAGSMTAKTLAVTGTATVTGTLTAGNALRVDTNTLVVDATNNRVGIGTTTPATELHVIGTITATGISGPGVRTIFIRKSSDETVNGTSTLQNDDELLFAIPASQTWLAEVFLEITNVTATPDFKYAFTAPAGLTSIIYGHTQSANSTFSSGTTTVGAAVPLRLNAASLVSGLAIQCLIVNGVNAGTVTFQWAQNTSTAENTTVKAGSFLLSTRLQ